MPNLKSLGQIVWLCERFLAKRLKKEKEQKEEEKEEKEIVTSVTYIAGLGPANKKIKQRINTILNKKK